MYKPITKLLVLNKHKYLHIYRGGGGGGMKSMILGVVVSVDSFVTSSSSLISGSGSASDNSVRVSSAFSTASCTSQRFLFDFNKFIMWVDNGLFMNRCHSVKRGVTTSLKKPTCILATDVDWRSQIEVMGRLSCLSYSPWRKNSSHTFKLHFLDISQGLVGFDMSAHFNAICRIKCRFSLLFKSSVSVSRCCYNTKHTLFQGFIYIKVPDMFTLNLNKNSGCLLISVAKMSSLICISSSSR